VLLLTTALAATTPAIAQQPPMPMAGPLSMHDDRSFGYAALNQNEWRSGNGVSTYRWAGEAWYGGNIDRAWLKSEGDLDTDTGTLDEGEAQALYARAVSAYFDLQAGIRYDVEPAPSRGWATVGVEGLAPLFWNVGAFAFASDGGHYGFRIEGSYDLYLTQRLVLQPQFEANAYTRSDPRSGLGAGLSSLDSGLRLRYEIRRQLAPYIGLSYDKRYGQTASFARSAGERVESLRFIVGARLWY
jgi:copper resistance protein B